MVVIFFSSRRRHTTLQGDWSSDVCSSDLVEPGWVLTTGVDAPVRDGDGVDGGSASRAPERRAGGRVERVKPPVAADDVDDPLLDGRRGDVPNADERSAPADATGLRVERVQAVVVLGGDVENAVLERWGGLEPVDDRAVLLHHPALRAVRDSEGVELPVRGADVHCPAFRRRAGEDHA